MVEFVPSPKSQKTVVGAGVEVFVKLTTSSWQTFTGSLKDAWIKFMTTAFGFTMVLLQPVLLVTTRVTVKLPAHR